MLKCINTHIIRKVNVSNILAQDVEVLEACMSAIAIDEHGISELHAHLPSGGTICCMMTQDL